MPRAAPKWIVRCGCALAVAWPLSMHGYRHATLLDLVANVRSAGLFARK